MLGFFSTSNTSDTSNTSGTTVATQRLYAGITFLTFLACAVGGAAAFLGSNHPGITFIPHGVNPEEWDDNACGSLCENPALQAGIQYLAQNEGQFRAAAAGVLEYCLKAGCDVIGSVLEDCVKGIDNPNEFLLAASAVGGAVLRGGMR